MILLLVVSFNNTLFWGYSLSKSLSYFLNTLEPGGDEIDVADKIVAV
jgi:hypothetical protein